MQVVILAAGRGSRMMPLTKDTPKPMLVHSGRNLLEHKLEALPNCITEVVFVIGYLGEKIREYFGDEFNGRKIKYVKQKDLNGTGGAIWDCRNVLKDRFIVLMGDDIYSKEDLENLVNTEFGILVKRDINVFDGVHSILINNDGYVYGIGKTDNGIVNMNTGAYCLNCNIFDLDPVLVPGNDREYSLPHTLEKVGNVKVVEAKYWKRITRPEDLK